MKSKILLFSVLIFQIISFNSCTKEAENGSDIESSLSFSLNFDSAKNEGLNKEDISINIDPADSTKISVVLPADKKGLITKLVPTIEFVGKKIEPNPSTIKDFSNPVSFTIITEKGEAKTYTITVSVVEKINTLPEAVQNSTNTVDNLVTTGEGEAETNTITESIF
ncbi:hypothetical protein [Ichthyobacterium seriolicida]|uniref:Pkd domain containing protein n=1 Tax=Ichthyobacterium seriolicida TaxID=242600 RepID=A0A1J1DZ87_9FLAO|nr:hypothetical protein [Ichthyobacterium seriolicida]BAV95231.1 hypothetical protein JBKA6_1218 [Ichthyobacterium seriolicida]